MSPVFKGNGVVSEAPNQIRPDTSGFPVAGPALPVPGTGGFQDLSGRIFPTRTARHSRESSNPAIQQRGGPDMAKKAATPATITLKHLAAAIAEEQELSKKQAEAILTDMVTRITKHLKKGERIRIVGLGILQVRKRAARMGRNPATGEQIHIKASKKVAFRAAKELKEAV
nr:HU family DNA-binding protein [Bradyrhizobium elkanii]